jgi:hypothetical protein
MHLVQLLLPLRDNDGRAFGAALFTDVRRELTARFGGLTAYSRAPAEGEWDGGEGRTHDDVVVHEVMADVLDRGWWSAFRADLERRFAQDEIVIRAHAVERL